jgi:hypothetical protein
MQRPSGLAQWRLPQMFLRAKNVHFRTAVSAEVLPPLRQTARCIAAELPVFHSCQILILLAKSNSAEYNTMFSRLFQLYRETCCPSPFHGFAPVSPIAVLSRYKITQYFPIFNIFAQKKSHCCFGLYSLF